MHTRNRSHVPLSPATTFAAIFLTLATRPFVGSESVRHFSFHCLSNLLNFLISCILPLFIIYLFIFIFSFSFSVFLVGAQRQMSIGVASNFVVFVVGVVAVAVAFAVAVAVAQWQQLRYGSALKWKWLEKAWHSIHLVYTYLLRQRMTVKKLCFWRLSAREGRHWMSAVI